MTVLKMMTSVVYAVQCPNYFYHTYNNYLWKYVAETYFVTALI